MNKSSKDPSLQFLFASESGQLPQDPIDSIADSLDFQVLKDHLLESASDLKWAVAWEEIRSRIPDLLDVPLSEILVGAWVKYHLLHQYTDRSKYPPDEIILVPFAEQKLKSKHHPYLELLVNESRIGKLVLDVEIQLELKGVVLVIQDAKIKEIKAGSCHGKGTIRYAGMLLLDKEIASFELPGHALLGDGFPIP